MLRMLIITQVFHPDTTAVSQLLTDLAEDLETAGMTGTRRLRLRLLDGRPMIHEVSVIPMIHGEANSQPSLFFATQRRKVMGGSFDTVAIVG